MFDDVLDPMMGVRNQMGVIGNPLGMVDPGNLQQFDKASHILFLLTRLILR
jgi:hypothetical protein